MEEYTTTTSEKIKTDGTFKLDYNEEGVFISISLGQNGGKGIDPKEIITYIKRKNILSADMSRITELISQGYAENEKIADAQEEIILDEVIEIEFTQGKMEAYIRLKEGEEKGKKFTKDEIMYELKEHYKIIYGIVNENIDDIISNRIYDTKVLCAKGKFPENGKDGELIFKFESDISNRPKFQTKEDGKLDYRTLNNLQNVEEGQLLIERVLATEGENGFDVCGREITAKKGKDFRMPGGKNIRVSDDGLSMFSAKMGRIEYVNGKVIVSQIYEINGDVDLTVGNINFPGDVVIKGKVNSGFKIIAGGKIVVGGLCEGAYLQSDGDIELRGGVQGGDKGKIVAGKSVYAKFIERAVVEAEEKVCSDFVFHSKIMCEGSVEILGNKGIIIGGYISAGNYFAGKTVGADSGIATTITIGISPKKREEYANTIKRMQVVKEAIDRIELSLGYTMSSFASNANNQMRVDVKMKLLTLKNEYETLKKDFYSLELQMNDTSTGNVHVTDVVYAGTRISIGSHNYSVKDEMKYVTFKVDEGEIVHIPCRFRA